MKFTPRFTAGSRLILHQDITQTLFLLECLLAKLYFPFLHRNYVFFFFFFYDKAQHVVQISTGCCIFKSKRWNNVTSLKSLLLNLSYINSAAGMLSMWIRWCCTVFFSPVERNRKTVYLRAWCIFQDIWLVPLRLHCCISFLQMSHFSSFFVLFLQHFHKSKYQTHFQKSYSSSSNSRTYVSQTYRVLCKQMFLVTESFNPCNRFLAS